jgi:hypothetical protein
MRLLYYKPSAVLGLGDVDLQGLELFRQLFPLIDRDVMLVDRTNTIRFPIRAKSLFPLPRLRQSRRSFEELCTERAAELLGRADRAGSRLYVFWSGGIDSTLALISLLKNATDAQTKNITVLLSEDSISEYPLFYQRYIRGKVRVSSAVMFPGLLGTDNIIVNGEHNDQLFGSDIVGELIAESGPVVMHKPYDRDLFYAFFNARVQNEAVVNFYLDLFERVAAAAPVAIETNFLFLWWINFSLKWQSVFMRTLSYAVPRMVTRIDMSYLRDNYAPFYCTDEFQIWSMQNLDKRIKDEWRTYKWLCKEIIYEFTKDPDYRDNKTKRGSLYFILLQQRPWAFINENVEYLREVQLSSYGDPANDFVGAFDKPCAAALTANRETGRQPQADELGISE